MLKKITNILINIIPLILVVFLLAAFVPLAIETPVEAAGNVYYVAKTGSDSNPGTEALPWRTIQKAANTLTAGDTVYVKAGTYNEQVVPANSGSSGSGYITYKNYGSDSVTITGSGIDLGYSNSGSTKGVFYINGKSYINVEGFTITGSTCFGVSVYGVCDHINIRNLKVNDTRSSGIYVSSIWNDFSRKPTNIVVSGCEVWNTNYGADQESITLIAVNNFEVANCKVHDVKGSGSGNFPVQNAIDAKSGCNNGSIHNNEVYNAMDGIYIDTGGAPSSNIKIYSNKVYNCKGAGIALCSERSPYSPITDVDIYNNIIHNNVLGFLADNYTRFHCNFRFFNNTLYFNGGHGGRAIFVGNPHSYYSNCLIRNNILVGQYTDSVLIQYDDYANGGVTIDHNLFYSAAGNIISNNKYGTNYIQANPLLVNPTTNFNIASNSPARDAGSSSGAPSFDYAGTSRPRGDGIDIGAYEYAGSGGDGGGTPVNRAPVLNSIGSKSVTAGQTLSFTISATDPDGNSLTYSASNLPAGASFNASTRTFSWTPSQSQPGYYHDVRFQVSDGSLTDSESITITVNNPVVENRAPILNSIGNKSVTAGQTLSFTISAIDPDGNSLTYSASNLPAGASFNASTRTFSWTPYPSQPGYYHDIRFQVSDGSLTDSESITITVNNPVAENRAPVLNSIGNKSVTAGQTLSFTISATDPDGNSLTYSASNLPAGASFNASTRTFSWTPSQSQPGYYHDVRFQVSDGSLTDSESITITVNNAVTNNQAPVLNPIGNKVVDATQPLSFTISAKDPDGDNLVYSASNLPAGASFNASTRTFTWTPYPSQPGYYHNIRFQVSDGSLTDYESITITVNGPNQVLAPTPKPTATPSSSSSSGGGGGGSTPKRKTISLNGFFPDNCLITDLMGCVSSDTQLQSKDGKVIIKVAKETRLQDAKGQVIKSIFAERKNETPEPPPGSAVIFNYDLGPDETRFEPELVLTLKYDLQELPAGSTADDLYIAHWDGSAWIPLESQVDTVLNTVMAKISHFSEYALLVDMPSPARFTISDIQATPSQASPDSPVVVRVTVKNSGESPGKYPLFLRVNGVNQDNKEILLDGGQTGNVAFLINANSPGEYTFDINGTTGKFNVLAPVVPESAEPDKTVKMLPAGDSVSMNASAGKSESMPVLAIVGILLGAGVLAFFASLFIFRRILSRMLAE